MTSMVAAIRPDDQNLPLFLHVLGAAILVGATLSSASFLAFARGDARLLRLGYWTLVLVALPALVVTRIAGEWLGSKQGWWDEGVPDQVWLGIGFIVTDLGGVLLLVALVLGGIGIRRLRSGSGTRLLTATMAITVVLLAAYLVAAWAMSAKPD